MPRKPVPDQQFAIQHVKDKQAWYPTRSWWIVPDEQFTAALAHELPRLQAMGCGTEKSQRPIGSEV